MVKTSIIILTYNSEKYIEPLIESINENNKNENFEIIVVDNDSKDDTVKKARSKNVEVLETGSNLGFAAGINAGSRKASGEYLLFINPDTYWRIGSINQIVSVFSNEKIGIVGGKLINKDGIAEKSCGKFFGFWASLLMALGLDELFGIRFAPKKVSKVDFVTGGFMTIKKSLFEKLQGFNENYFIYFEDVDICFRAKKLGFTTYFTPEAEIVHDIHGSSNRGFAIKNIYKGLLFFQKQYYSYLSYIGVKSILYIKAASLVLIGKISNNKYLVETYSQVL